MKASERAKVMRVKAVEPAAPSLERPRVLLVGGVPRSGTTLLADILNEHPSIAVMAEYSVADLLRDLTPIYAYGQALEKHLATSHEQLEKLQQEDDADAESEATAEVKPPALAAAPVWFDQISNHDHLQHRLRYPGVNRAHVICANVIRAALDKPEATVIGSKTPIFMAATQDEVVRGVFGQASYLFAIRHPEGQINSSLNRRNRTLVGIDHWTITAVDEAILEWRQVVAQIYSYVDSFPSDTFVVKYEDLGERSEDTTAALGRFLGVDQSGFASLASPNPNRKSVLTAVEKRRIRRELAAIMDVWDQLRITGIGRDVREALATLLPPPPRAPISFQGVQQPCLGRGWSFTEPDGVWTCAAAADLVFGAADSTTAIMLRMKARAFIPREAGHLRLRIEHNGKHLAEVVFAHGDSAIAIEGTSVVACRDDALQTIWLGPVKLSTQGANLFRFTFTGLTTPNAEGMGEDSRTLGLFLAELMFARSD